MSPSTINITEAEDIARRIYESTRYAPDEEDILILTQNIVLIENRGLSGLNQRLISSGRKIWDTFVEHNFAVSLVQILKPDVSIEYEPSQGLRRPPDFKITKGDITYWVQIKNLSRLERENRQDVIIRQIQRQVEEIEIGYFYGCRLGESFTQGDINPLVTFIRDIIHEVEIGQEYAFPNTADPKAHIEFWLPQKTHLSHLTLGISGDLDIVEQTGHAREQIKSSIVNAAGAFEWVSDQKTVNLIAMDADRHEDIDLCDAVFGTEYEIFKDGKFGWGREDNGLYLMTPFNVNIFGVIGLRKKETGHIISPYRMFLFLNEAFSNDLPILTDLFTFDMIIHYNMRPPMGYGKF